MGANAHTNPWTADDDRTLTALHAAGKSVNAIAREMGRGKATVSDHGAKLGLTWDRTRTAKAAQAVAVDNKARRVAIVARLYTEAESDLADLEAGRTGHGWRTILKDTGGAEREAVLTFVPPVDRRTMADALHRNLTSAAKLEQIDAGDKPNAVRDLLTGIAERMGIVDAP